MMASMCGDLYVKMTPVSISFSSTKVYPVSSINWKFLDLFRIGGIGSKLPRNIDR